MTQNGGRAPTPLPLAATDDVLTGADLAQAVLWLKAQARALDAQKQPTLSLPELAEINRQQARLLGQATALIALRIRWTAGQARLEAGHINDAIAYAQAVIDRVGRLRATLDALTAVLNFFGVLMAGEPVAIVKAGIRLRKDLDGVR